MAQVLFEWNFDSFHKDADRIYRIELLRQDGRYSQMISFPSLHQLIENSSQIEAGGIKTNHRFGSITMPDDTTGEKFIEAKFCYITKGYTDVFTFDMIEGSTDSIQNPECAIIPLSLAEKLYGKRASYLGETFGDNVSWFLRVGGVYRDFPKNSMMFNMVYQIPNEGWFNQYMSRWNESSYFGYFKLNKGVDPAALEKSMKITYPDGEEVTGRFRLFPLKDIYYTSDSSDTPIKGNRNINRLLFSIALLIVVIASVNFINFSMALVPTKIKSINTQLVLGASGSRLRLSLILEALTAATVAYLISLISIYLISRTSMASFIDADIAFQQQWGLVIGTLVVALFSGFISGSYPAYYITSFAPVTVINRAFALSPKGRLLRNCLIGLQFTISLIVMIVTLFMYLQNRYLHSESPGFDKELLVNTILTQKLRIDTPDAFVSKLKENPAIEEVAFTEQQLGSSDQFMRWSMNSPKGKGMVFFVLPVTSNFLKVLGVEVIEGRDFRPEDEHNASYFIFNETAKRLYNLDVGESMDVSTITKSKAEIIGFIPDIKFQSFHEQVKPMAFLVWGNEDWKFRSRVASIRIAAGANTHAAIQYIKKICTELDPKFTNEIRFYDTALKELYTSEQQQYTLVSIFSLLIIFISIVGVFGLVTFETQTRRREVGICKAFGSNMSQVLYLFNKTYVRIVLVCFAIAVPLGYRITEIWMQNFAYHISLHVWVFLVALLIVLVAVSLTVTVQCWRAANANPIDSMKN